MMEFGIGLLFFAGLVTGVIGMLLGITVDKGGAGFWLGAFLGPIGWIIVLLLPRDIESESGHSQSAPQRNIPAPLPEDTNISSNSYRLYLGKKYNIQRNDLFQQFECKEELFESLDAALAFADELEKEEREKIEADKALPTYSPQFLTRIQNDLNERSVILKTDFKGGKRLYFIKDISGKKTVEWDGLVKYWQETVG